MPAPCEDPALARFEFDGRAFRAPAGRMLAAALIDAGDATLRANPVDGSPRGAFCLMGVCQDCVVLVEGLPIEACRLPVRDGLVARTRR